jgi:uncharacterized protein YjlB
MVQYVQQNVFLDYFPPHHVAQNRPPDLGTDEVFDYWHKFSLTHQQLILQNLVDSLVLGGTQEGQNALVGTLGDDHLEKSGHVAVAKQQDDVGVGDH